MTEKLYDLDSYLKEFDAFVSSCQITAKGGELILDRTAFFPEGGGQSSDIGEINGYHIKDVRNAGDEIVHYIDLKDNENEQNAFLSLFSKGTKVHGKIDWQKRFERMQQHSGEHLLSGSVFRHFGFANTGFHLSDNGTTVDFNGTFSDEDLIMIENEVNAIISANVPSHIYFPSPEELDKLPYRSKKELTGPVRIVEFGDNVKYDICACCAPHVRSTLEIGLFKILSAEHFRGGTRMEIACGQRLLSELRLLQQNNRAISQLLSVKPENTAQGVEKLNESFKALKFSSIKTERELLELKAKYAEEPVLFLESADTGNIRSAVNMLAQRFPDDYCCSFTGEDGKGYNYIITSTTKDCTELLSRMKSELHASGGGSKTMIQGNIKSPKAEIENFLS